MTCEKTHQGAWRITERLKNGDLFKRLIFFCSQREAISRFKTELRIKQETRNKN